LNLQYDAKISLVDFDGWSALHHACFGGHLGCVQLLLNNLDLVDIKDKVRCDLYGGSKNQATTNLSRRR